MNITCCWLVSALLLAAPSSALLDASEIFEELAQTKVDDVGLDRALAAFEALRPAVSKALSAQKRSALDAAVAGVREGWQRHDRGAVAIQAIEAYRVLQESLDRKGQRVPLEVSLLDYAGFKSKGLLVSTHPDWVQAAQTAQDASGWWAVIRSRVKDETLRAAMDHAISGLKDAAARRDALAMAFAADLDLILVDGLEALFNNPR